MRPAASGASPALHRAKTMEPRSVRSPSRLATMVATIAPAATGHRALGPRAINTPAATPEAGQNTATPSGLVSSARLSRAARKYATPTAAASPIGRTQAGTDPADRLSGVSGRSPLHVSCNPQRAPPSASLPSPDLIRGLTRQDGLAARG